MWIAVLAVGLILSGLLAAAPADDRDDQVVAALRAEVARLRADVETLRGQVAALAAKASPDPGNERRQQTPAHLTARSLMIVDERGRSAVKIHGRNGFGEIALWDANRDGWKPQLSIGCIPPERGGGTQIFMHGADGTMGINLVAQERGSVTTK